MCAVEHEVCDYTTQAKIDDLIEQVNFFFSLIRAGLLNSFASENGTQHY